MMDQKLIEAAARLCGWELVGVNYELFSGLRMALVGYPQEDHYLTDAGLLALEDALLAYWIVLWAITQAPMALVAAVREASIVFAVMIGAVFLKERLDLRRVVAVFVTTVGLVFLKAGK